MFFLFTNRNVISLSPKKLQFRFSYFNNGLITKYKVLFLPKFYQADNSNLSSVLLTKNVTADTQFEKNYYPRAVSILIPSSKITTREITNNSVMHYPYNYKKDSRISFWTQFSIRLRRVLASLLRILPGHKRFHPIDSITQCIKFFIHVLVFSIWQFFIRSRLLFTYFAILCMYSLPIVQVLVLSFDSRYPTFLDYCRGSRNKQHTLMVLEDFGSLNYNFLLCRELNIASWRSLVESFHTEFSNLRFIQNRFKDHGYTVDPLPFLSNSLVSKEKFYWASGFNVSFKNWVYDNPKCIKRLTPFDFLYFSGRRRLTFDQNKIFFYEPIDQSIIDSYNSRFYSIYDSLYAWKKVFNNLTKFNQGLPPVPQYIIKAEDYIYVASALFYDILAGGFDGTFAVNCSYKYQFYYQFLISELPFYVFETNDYLADQGLSSMIHLGLLDACVHADKVDLHSFFTKEGYLDTNSFSKFFTNKHSIAAKREHKYFDLRKSSKSSVTLAHRNVLTKKKTQAPTKLLATKFCIPEVQTSAQVDDYGYGWYGLLELYLRTWQLMAFFNLAMPETDDQKLLRQMKWRLELDTDMYDFNNLTLTQYTENYALDRYNGQTRLISAALVLRPLEKFMFTLHEQELEKERRLKQAYLESQSTDTPWTKAQEYTYKPAFPAQHFLYNLDVQIALLQEHYKSVKFSFNRLDYIEYDDTRKWPIFYIFMAYVNHSVAEEFPKISVESALYLSKIFADADPRLIKSRKYLADSNFKPPCFLFRQFHAQHFITENFMSADTVAEHKSRGNLRYKLRAVRSFRYSRGITRSTSHPWDWRF